MEANLQGGGAEAPVMHVKTEAADESPSALVLGSRSPPAPCGDAACGAGGGGGQTAEELQAVTTPPVLLCEQICVHYRPNILGKITVSYLSLKLCVPWSS